MPEYDIAEINNALSDESGNMVVSGGRFSRFPIYYFNEIDSTNSWLIKQKDIDGKICLAENQTSGRGRSGKSWIGYSNSSILISLGWGLNGRDIQGLSLVSGLAVMQSLLQFNVSDVKLKWPNDVFISGKKVGGILIEISGSHCVIGIGLNVSMPNAANELIDQPWIDLQSAGFDVSRDELVVSLIRNHDVLLTSFSENGFAGFMDQWNAVNVYKDQMVEAVCGEKKLPALIREWMPGEL